MLKILNLILRSFASWQWDSADVIKPRTSRRREHAGSPRWPQSLHRVLRSEEPFPELSELQVDVTVKAGSERYNTAGFEGRGGAVSQDRGQPLEVRKDKRKKTNALTPESEPNETCVGLVTHRTVR